MAKAVIMPKFGFTQEQSTIVRWLKKEGDRVEKGEPLVEVTTDKIDMEVEAPENGLLGGIRFKEGAIVPVTETIAYILAEGEALPATLAAAPISEPVPVQAAPPEPPSAQGAIAATPVARRVAEVMGVDLATVTGSGPGGKITREDVERAPRKSIVRADGKVRATPAARRAAREAGVDLATVSGSGPYGRVQSIDVRTIIDRQAASPAAPAVVSPQPAQAFAGEPTIIPLEGIRKTIAERMQASAQQAPHILFMLDVDMTKAIAFRDDANQRLAEGLPSISMTALIVKACAWALHQHPVMNSYLRDNQIMMMPSVNIGVAVALDQGLIVPVVRDADRKGLREIGREVDDLTQRARAGRLHPQDVVDGTFTVSNLGMYGIDRFTAIINPPQVGILAVGRIARQFVPDENDQPVARPLMAITLSADHRAIDGASGAQFITTLRDALEDPARIIL